MAGRNPTELRELLRSIDYSGSQELLTELQSEARATVDTQKETLADIDTKAIRILRLNVLLIGVIVSALSITAQFGGGPGSSLPHVARFNNLYVKSGIGSLVLSTAFAAVTYTTSELDVGLSSNNLAGLLQAEFDSKRARELLVKNYIMRINFNRSTNIRNIPLITWTITLVVAGVMFFTLGVYEAIVGPVSAWLLVSTGFVLGWVVVASGLVKQSLRAIRNVVEWRKTAKGLYD